VILIIVLLYYVQVLPDNGPFLPKHVVSRFITVSNKLKIVSYRRRLFILFLVITAEWIVLTPRGCVVRSHRCHRSGAQWHCLRTLRLFTYFSGWLIFTTWFYSNHLKPSGFFTYHQVWHSKILLGARFVLSVLYGSLLYTSLTDWFL
jgi:hypothetical protein